LQRKVIWNSGNQEKKNEIGKEELLDFLYRNNLRESAKSADKQNGGTGSVVVATGLWPVQTRRAGTVGH
jgi:hypothetical protein